jgi:hypothetical protein
VRSELVPIRRSSCSRTRKSKLNRGDWAICSLRLVLSSSRLVRSAPSVHKSSAASHVSHKSVHR